MSDLADQQPSVQHVISPRKRRSINRRRIAVQIVEQSGAIQLRTLAAQVASVEKECEVEDISAHEIKQVAIDLYHTQIPKLTAAGIVEYDRERNTVAATE